MRRSTGVAMLPGMKEQNTTEAHSASTRLPQSPWPVPGLNRTETPSVTPTKRGRLLWSSIASVLVLAGLSACAGLGFTIESAFRSSRDYDELDRDRALLQPTGGPSELGTEPPAAYWTQYRGPHGNGVYDEQELLLSWSEGAAPRLWSVALGPAYSSVVVAGGLVITMEQRREREAVVAFDLEDGRLVWEHSWPARFYQVLSKEGPRATPAVQGELVVALGAKGELRCLDLATGALQWRSDLLNGSPGDNLNFGLSASPRIRNGVVFAQGAESVSAFELATGEIRWTALSETMAYSTPQFGELLGSTHLVVCTKKRVLGLDADSGVELWSFPWKFLGDTCTQPMILGPNRVLASSGYGKGSQLVALEQGPSGIESTILWRSAGFKTRYNEPILHDGRAYGLDEGTLACIDVESGSRLWKQGRYGYGQLLLYREHLLVVDEDGQVHVLRLDPEGPVELTRFEGVDGGMTLNLPALAHGRLFVRNEKTLVVFDLRAPSSARLPRAELQPQ